jgi:hypothetical protein
MQYLLTQEEYEGLRAKAARGQKLPSTADLQTLCTKIANEMPVVFKWSPEMQPRPWGCILNKRGDRTPSYCDECPVKSICPNSNKNWSK